MGQYHHHLVRRAVEAAHQLTQQELAAEISAKVQPWAVAVIVITCIIGLTGALLLDYVLWRVIATLASVETPEAVPAVSLPSNSKLEIEEKGIENAPLLEDHDATLPAADSATPVFITSSIRRTVAHLRRTSGTVRGLFRGLGYSLLHFILFAVLTVIFTPRGFPQSAIGNVVISVLLAPIHAAATHSILASTRTIPSRQVWKHLMLPAAVVPAADAVVGMIPTHVGPALGLRPEIFSGGVKLSCADKAFLGAKLAFVIILTLATLLFVYLPACVALVRVEASLLLPSDETIVPVDCTFGGRAVSARVKGDDERVVMRFVEAWRSFGREAWFRLTSLGVKFTVIDMMVGSIIGVVIAIVAFAVAGDAIMLVGQLAANNSV